MKLMKLVCAILFIGSAHASTEDGRKKRSLSIETEETIDLTTRDNSPVFHTMYQDPVARRYPWIYSRAGFDGMNQVLLSIEHIGQRYGFEQPDANMVETLQEEVQLFTLSAVQSMSIDPEDFEDGLVPPTQYMRMARIIFNAFFESDPERGGLYMGLNEFIAFCRRQLRTMTPEGREFLASHLEQRIPIVASPADGLNPKRAKFEVTQEELVDLFQNLGL